MTRYLLTLSVILTTIFSQPARADESRYQRIISLSPAITEMAFAVGAGERVVGVTRYCRYPPEAKDKVDVGGLLDTNFEMIYRLRPDLIALPVSESLQKSKLEKMGFRTMEIKEKSVQGILESLRELGEALGAGDRAETLAAGIEQQIEDIRVKVQGVPRPRVLITFSRTVGTGKVTDVYIAGKDGFFDDLMALAGGENAYPGVDFSTSPLISAEGILLMDPDVIIEIMTEMPTADPGLLTDQALKDWASLPQLKACKNHRIYILTQDYPGIPGPRLGQTLTDLARRIHPEVFGP